MTATLKNTLGESAAIELPRSLAEVPLSRYIDFIVECRDFGNPEKNQVTVMAKACGAFYGQDLETMLSRTLREVEGADIAGLDGSLSQLLGYALEVVRSAGGQIVSPEQAEVAYMGEVYRMPVFLQGALTGQDLLPGVTVIEAVEAAEVQRLASQTIEGRGNPGGQLRKRVMDMVVQAHGGEMPPPEVLKSAERMIQDETAKAGDPDGSIIYSMYLNLLALLLRKDGEQLPVDDGERAAFVDARAAHFQQIDAQTALNVDFFLLNTSGGSESGHPAIGSLSRPMFDLLAATRLRAAKPAPKPNRKTRRSLAASGGGKSSLPSSKGGGMAKSRKPTAPSLRARSGLSA